MSFRLTIGLQFYLQTFVFILITATNNNGQDILGTGCYFAHLRSIPFFCICVAAQGEKVLHYDRETIFLKLKLWHFLTLAMPSLHKCLMNVH